MIPIYYFFILLIKFIISGRDVTTFLELWLGMIDEHEELLSCGLSWRVLQV